MEIHRLLFVIVLVCLNVSTLADTANLALSPKIVHPTENLVYPPKQQVYVVLELPNVSYQACGLWTFDIEILGQSDSQEKRISAPAQWNPEPRNINTGTGVIRASGCLGIKRTQLPEGSYSVKASAKHAYGNSTSFSAWRSFSVLGQLPSQRQAVPEEPQLPDRKPVRTRPDIHDLKPRPQPKATSPKQALSQKQAIAVHKDTGKTDVKVRDTSKKPPKWGTDATIHHHQEIQFLWNTSAPGVSSAEWQVWDRNPTGRSVPETAKLTTGALGVTGAMSQFPIYFGTFLPKLPPALPAERKYWVTVVTKDSSGETVGPTPRPVTVTYKACTSKEECSEGYFCDPDTRSCEKVEIFCAGGREIPGYKGTGYSKVEFGRWVRGRHIQGTDGTVVRCVPYRCRTMQDGTPQCLTSCGYTGDCDSGACSSDGKCVR